MQRKLGIVYKLIKRHLTLTYTGLENIDPTRNYIFAMNHQSIIDIPVAFSILIPLINQELNLYISHKYYYPLWPIFKPLKTIKMFNSRKMTPKKKRVNELMISKGVNLLKKGNSVLIFPEGTIYGGKNSNVIQGKTGAVRLSALSGVSIIPIGIKGSNEVLPIFLGTKNPFTLKRKHPIQINVGKEIKPSELDLTTVNLKNKTILRNRTNKLMIELASLSKLAYKPLSI